MYNYALPSNRSCLIHLHSDDLIYIPTNGVCEGTRLLLHTHYAESSFVTYGRVTNDYNA